MRAATERVRPPAPPSTTRSPTSALAEEPIGSAGRSSLASACTRPKPVSWSIAERMARRDAAVMHVDPDRLGLGDQVADREDQAVAEKHAVAGALVAERLRGEGVGRNDGVQADNGGERALEVVAVILGARLRGGGDFPFGQFSHRESP